MKSSNSRLPEIPPALGSPRNAPAAWIATVRCTLGLIVTLGTKVLAQEDLSAPFTRITDGAIGAEAAFSVVGAWGDFDNDGWPDLFVGNQRGATSWLFRNGRNGTFTRMEAEPLTTDVFGESWSAAWVDHDNDGWVDLIMSNHDGTSPLRIYQNSGGSFRLLSNEQLGQLADAIHRTQGIAWADYDKDGLLDLFVANGDLGKNYPDALYHNDGNGRFTRVNNTLTSPVLSSSMGSWSDFDNDGDMDLLVPHTNGGGNTLFRNQGQGQFSRVSDSGLTSVGESIGAAWGDYDNDGDLDLFIVNVQFAGPVTSNFFYRNRGDGTFERITSGPLVTDLAHFVSCAWVDYDNDGWLDLFVTVLSGSNRLYRNQGDGTFAAVNQGSLVTDVDRFGSSAWADYDNDGFPDLFVTCGTIFVAAPSALYHNDGNANKWIKIRCVGTDSNRSAIGAKVRVKARISGKDVWQMRQIVGTEGWVTFNSLEALIGLGDAAVVDTVRVEWPSGAVQEFHGLEAGKVHVIVERTGLQVLRTGENQLELKISGPRQQRYRFETSPDLERWSTLGGLTITRGNGTGTLPLSPSADDQRRFYRVVAE